MFDNFRHGKAQTFTDPVEEFYRPHGRTEVQRLAAMVKRWGKAGKPVKVKSLTLIARDYVAYLRKAKVYVEGEIELMKDRAVDYMSYVSYGLVFLLGLAVTTMALYVDYTILEEIWSRNFANEFFEVPESLRSSVTFKSLQVVFAVLALHYFISSIGKLGRGIYIGVLTAMVLTMLVGIGFLNVTSSLPVGSQLFGVELTGETLSAEEELAALGLEADVRTAEDARVEEPSAPPFGLTEQGYESAKTILFFMSFGLIFFFVSSVGALSLHYAITAFVDFTGGTRKRKAQSDYRRSLEDRGHARLQEQQKSAEYALQQIENPDEAVQSFIPLLTSVYLEGLERGRLRFRRKAQAKREEQFNRAVAQFLRGLETGAIDLEGGDDEDGNPKRNPNRISLGVVDGGRAA